MGFKSRLKDINTFKPMELNEDSVQTIFNRCLAIDDTTEYIKSILQQREHGYSQDSEGILFDRAKILSNLRTIRYLYGQLITTHDKSNTINTSTKSRSNVMTTYLGNVWTMNNGTILQFYHLGVASGVIHPLSLEGNSSFKGPIRPTLSPKDPAFPAWWEAHKAEWEQ